MFTNILADSSSIKLYLQQLNVCLKRLKTQYILFFPKFLSFICNYCLFKYFILCCLFKLIYIFLNKTHVKLKADVFKKKTFCYFSLLRCGDFVEDDVERLLAEVGKISRVFDESPELFDAKFTVKDETLNR